MEKLLQGQDSNLHEAVSHSTNTLLELNGGQPQFPSGFNPKDLYYVYSELLTPETGGHGCQFHHPARMTLIMCEFKDRLVVQMYCKHPFHCKYFNDLNIFLHY